MAGNAGNESRTPDSSMVGEGSSDADMQHHRSPGKGTRVQSGSIVQGQGVLSNSSAREAEDWPSIQQSIAGERKRRLTLAPGALITSGSGNSGCQPTTKGGKKRLNEQIAGDIKQHLFAGSTIQQLDELALACDRLEESMNRMSLIAGGQENCQEQRSKQLGREVEDDKFWGELDDRFSHSWRPIGPSKGWFWIPKGRLTMDITYPAHLTEIRRYGYQARKIRPTPLPPPLSLSFAAAARNPMAHRETQRQAGKRW